MNRKTRFALPGLKTLLAAVQLGLLLVGGRAEDYHVPSNYATIQEAIAAAQADNNADNQIVLEDLVTDAIDISGFGTSTGGVYTVSGTIGQPDAGTLTGGA
jgi:hypothetical protein